MQTIQVEPIGHLRSPYREKFGVPRQSGMVPEARGRLVFEKPFRREEALRGLEEFTHLWIVFLFDQVKEAEVKLSVRPPRLGGNEKAGVFATRSPFRPNRLGLSVCRLEGIDAEAEDGPVLRLSGVDVVDGTPVLDVKPYLPYADCIPEAGSGLAPALPPRVEVTVAPEANEAFECLDPEVQALARQSLGWDARPAYHDGDRPYYLCLGEHEIAWRIKAGKCEILGIGQRGGKAGNSD